ncbi:MAG: nucleoside diphosphate kinase regulator [Alphaproteobacteria bacterium]|nr:nucleoside diphosphate kinase regulator [Alphaproteobacteria bacterium]
MTTRTITQDRRPAITLSDRDRARLTSLANAALARLPDEAEFLLDEIERARIVGADAAPDDLVRMGSAVTFRVDDGEIRRATLVYPEDADFAAGRISILTPVGAALIGLSTGQSIAWTRRDGSLRRVEVLAVESPHA